VLRRIVRRWSPVVTLTVLLAILGGGIAIGWVTLSDVNPLALRVRPRHVVLLVALTATNVLLRFLRWHYLLRRVDVRIPTRSSLVIFLGSLAAIATPAYLGELIRLALIRRRFGTPIGRTLPVLVAERGLDVMALATIGMLSARSFVTFGIMAAVAVVAAIALTIGARLGRRTAGTARSVANLSTARVVVPASALSLAAWLSVVSAVSLSAAAVGASVPLVDGAQIFARATLLGGLSLMPAGIGTTGSAAILGLQGLGLDLETSVAIVTVMRAVTAGAALTVGIVCLALALRERDVPVPIDSRVHFEEIAAVYVDQLQPHVRDLLVERKTALIRERLAAAGRPMVAGLDFGCGHGAHSLALQRGGLRIVGIDPSVGSVTYARRAGADALVASGTALPFPDATFDFVFAIGVLHHLSADEARRQAFGEIRRVLKPHGRLLVHETNPRNLLFRFYMGYVFPLIRRIDEGTEEWLDPRTQQIPGMTRISTDYATFLPDFAPRPLLSLFLRLERRLEQSRWRGYAVHYLAVFEKI
jgi:ubiquinone/menaquinone biosynthesis C-methylase UbiE/uncharacterized membrane protein YbhN (UPF0104 family)